MVCGIARIEATLEGYHHLFDTVDRIEMLRLLIECTIGIYFCSTILWHILVSRLISRCSLSFVDDSHFS